MSSTHPTYSMVLVEYADGTWTAEPVGLPGYRSGQHLSPRTGLDELLATEARHTMAAALGTTDRFGFHLRFLDVYGKVAATSDITSRPSGRHHATGDGIAHEQVEVSEELRQRIDA